MEDFREVLNTFSKDELIEQDGIGMYTDSEWVYLEMRDKIQNYIEENNLQL